jgi:aspartate aminotransferase
MQALGASGACHMGALFLKLNYGPWQAAGADRRVYIPTESWSELFPHPLLFAQAASPPISIIDKDRRSFKPRRMIPRLDD